MAKGKKPNKHAKPLAQKRSVWSVDPDPELKQMMEDAIRATGKSTSDLIRECVRENLEDVVKKLAEQQAQALRDFLSTHASEDKPSSKP